MNDNTSRMNHEVFAPTPDALIRFSAWLPLACLALTAVAFGLDAPARLAHRSLALASLRADNVMRDEPVMFPMPSLSRAQRLPSSGFLRR